MGFYKRKKFRLFSQSNSRFFSPLGERELDDYLKHYINYGICFWILRYVASSTWRSIRDKCANNITKARSSVARSIRTVRSFSNWDISIFLSINHCYNQFVKYVAVNPTALSHINFTEDNFTRKQLSLVHHLVNKFYQSSLTFNNTSSCSYLPDVVSLGCMTAPPILSPITESHLTTTFL